MNKLIDSLLKLQSLEFDDKVGPDTEKQIAELRAKVPAPILGHYDRLVARGKKGVAIVQKEVCTACHMRVPRGVVMTLMHGDDVQLCGNCGRYLHLPEQPEISEIEVPVKPVKPEKKSKTPPGRKMLLRAA